jgi:hypothetical protein
LDRKQDEVGQCVNPIESKTELPKKKGLGLSHDPGPNRTGDFSLPFIRLAQRMEKWTIRHWVCICLISSLAMLSKK